MVDKVTPAEAREFVVEYGINTVEDFRSNEQFCNELKALGQLILNFEITMADAPELRELLMVRHEQLAVFRIGHSSMIERGDHLPYLVQ